MRIQPVCLTLVLLTLSPAMSASAPPKKAVSWSAFVNNFIEDTFKANPFLAVYQGRHEFDGQIPDWSDKSFKTEIRRLKHTITAAQAFREDSLTREQDFERHYLIAVAKGRLFWLETADEPHRNPSYYMANGLDPGVYATRPYAKVEERLRAYIKYLKAIPHSAKQIQSNLRTPLPSSFIDYGVSAFAGMAEYYLGDGKTAFAAVRDSKLRHELEASSKTAANAMRALTNWLSNQRAQANQDFTLGADKFAQMLRDTEMVSTSLNELESLGWADLKRNQEAYRRACEVFQPGSSPTQCARAANRKKTPGGPVAGARAQLIDLKRFLIKSDLVTIPGPEEALVEEAPAYNRQNSAYIEIPGPYEKGLPSVYYIAPPDPTWPKEVQEGFVPSRGDLLFTSVHEVWPGHFLNFLHAARSKSIFGRVFVGYAFAEGWAHYTEEMMREAGLGNGDPEMHIGQLSNALLRNCRFLSAIALHSRRMTQDQSRELFQKECYQDEGTARQQAARGTYDPAYLNYTLGKLMIMRLREDWTKARAGRAAWKAFHDDFLSYGGPPIPLVRQQMLGGEAKAVF